MSVDCSPISTIKRASVKPDGSKERIIAIGSGSAAITFNPRLSINSSRSSAYEIAVLVRSTSCCLGSCRLCPSGTQSTLASSTAIGMYWSIWYLIVLRSSASLMVGTSITVVNVFCDGKPIATSRVFIPLCPIAVIIISPNFRFASGESLAVVLASTGA